jgi:hypothetical protein
MSITPKPAAAIRAALLRTFLIFAPGVALSLLVTSTYLLFCHLGAGR